MGIFNHISQAALGSALISVFATSLPAPSYAADMDKGKSLYLIHCSVCHGIKGKSVNPAAPNFASGERLTQPDSTLIGVIRSGKNSMPPFMGVLNDREIMDVISYSRTLQW